MNKEIIVIKDYSTITYKKELIDFYNKIKELFKEINNINNSKIIEINILNIKNELDLKNNKASMDVINNTFKPLININNDIKKTLNNWKSNFAGKNGLDNLIEITKENLLKPLKQKQIEYHNFITKEREKEILRLQELQNNENVVIEEPQIIKPVPPVKTTLGLREYTRYKILSINADILPKEYFTIDTKAIENALKSGVNVIGVKFEIIKELK